MALDSTRGVWMEPEDASWFTLVCKNPRANLFHHPAWVEVLRRSYSFEPRLIGIIDSSGVLLGGLPVMVVKNIYQRKRWVSLPFSDHCNPLFLDGELTDQLLSNLGELCKAEGCPAIEIRCEYQPPAGSGWVGKSAYVLSRVRLAPDENEVAKRIKPKHFRQVKVAFDRGVRVELGVGIDSMREFYKLHIQTRRRKGLPVQPWRFFQAIYDSIICRDLGFVLLAYSTLANSVDGEEGPVHQCVSAAVFFHWNQTLTYKYAASSEQARPILAMDAILWKAIQWGCGKGYEWLDMGRTDITDQGLRSFKHRWGAEEFPLSYFVWQDKVAKKESEKSSELLHTVMRHSPLWVCRAAGELLYKYYG